MTLPAGLAQRYEIRQELGRGATSVVHLAWDVFGQREVALKIANPQIFRDDAEQALLRKAWLNEVRIAGSLQHPYIVDVFDAGMGDDCAYLAMEYLPGGTLAAQVRPERLLPVEEVLELAYKCASALDYASRAGVIHRDIKPANLQYLGPGEVKVGDFGAAYWSRDDSATQILDVGSLAYMAPELFSHTVTPQADIYALGVVLHQLLTGQRPFDAPDQASLIYRIIEGRRDPLRSYRPDLPASLDTLFERLLARDLEQRFRSWSEVLVALADCSSTLSLQFPLARSKPPEAELYDQLRALPLLAPLNDAQLWELLRISRWRDLPAGSVCVREGGEARSCYLLLRGEARVSREQKLIAMLDPGTLFGELAFAEDPPQPRAATVVTATPAVVGKWSYRRLRDASPGLRSKMLEIFFRLAADRLKQSDERYLRLYRQLQGG